jgi:hypothetical protein
MTDLWFSPLATTSLNSEITKLAGSYPKLVVDLSFSVSFEGGADATFPPDSIIARIDVIHNAGLEGEYEWLKLKGANLKPAAGSKRQAKISESLPQELRLVGHYKLRIRSQAINLRFGAGRSQYVPAVKISLVDKKGKATVIYDIKYTAPAGGLRAVDDVIVTEFPPFTP